MVIYRAITQRYYAAWLDVDPDQLDAPGIVAVVSPKREVRQTGYSRPFHVYAYIAGDTTIISHHRDLANRVDALIAAFRTSLDLGQAGARLPAILGPATVQHARKYTFTSLPLDLSTDAAHLLSRDDYADFLAFHTALYPTADQRTWLRDYFTHLVDHGNLYGVYAGGRLVSAADLPDVPYMADLVAEPGIATLPAYRRRGYAKAAVGALLKHLLAQRKTPLWSCAAANTASDRLARSVGFENLADVITVTLEHAIT